MFYVIQKCFRTALPRGLLAALAVTLVSACAPLAAGTDALSGTKLTNALTGSGPVTSQINPSMCLDVAGGSDANGTAVQIAHCSGSRAQAWSFSGHAMRVFGTKCLSVVQGQTADNAGLEIQDCAASVASQSFTLNGTQLVWTDQNKCLDVPFGYASDGTLLQMHTCMPGNSASAWDLTAVASDTPSAPPAPAGRYTKLVWSDEFSGAGVDTSKWSAEQTCAPNNNEQQCYTNAAENAQGDGQGNLVISVIKASGLANGRGYTSARLNTQGKGDWAYGRFEMRAKMPRGQGLWPAFWMMPTHSVYGTWPTSGELDITEMLGHQTASNYGTAHYGLPAPYTQSQGVSRNVDLAADFHVFALERDAHQIRWYFDGALFYTLNDTDAAFWPAGYTPQDHTLWPFEQKFFLILNVAMGGEWPGAPDPSLSGGAMTVDYVRVYQ